MFGGKAKMPVTIPAYAGAGVSAAAQHSKCLEGLFMSIPFGFYSYAMYPLPFLLCLQWFIYGLIEFVICGLIAAAIYKPKKV